MISYYFLSSHLRFIKISPTDPSGAFVSLLVLISVSEFLVVSFEKIKLYSIFDGTCNRYRFRMIHVSINVCGDLTNFGFDLRVGILLQFTNRILLLICKFR